MVWLSSLHTLLVSFLLGGCDVAPQESSTERDWVVSSLPANGDRDVSRLGRMAITLDRRVYPQRVDGSTVRIVSGDVSSQLVVYFEPVTKRIMMYFYPQYPLEPFTIYRLVVEDLVDLDKNTQPESHQIIFQTGSRLDETIPWPQVEWKDIHSIFQRSCAVGTCHSASTAAMGLDLSSATGTKRTAIGASSRQLPTNATPSESVRGALSFSGFRIIDVAVVTGRPASSYIMYKLLGDSHILGNAMPPSDADVPRLDRDELEAISNWILYGAQTDSKTE
jgi:hypothetical protein